MALRLNLACGSDVRVGDGWVNLDIVRQWPNSPRPCEVIWDARTDKIPYPDASVDEICAGYLLLHVSSNHHKPLVAEMYRVLKPGGRVVIDDCDMAEVMRRWLENPDDVSATTMAWGEMGEHHGAEFIEYDTHRSGLTPATLTRLLISAGFHDVRRLNLHAPAVWYALTVQAFK